MEYKIGNSELSLIVRPDLGGRIDQLTDLRTRKDWLWHPEGYEPSATRNLEPGASFDKNWTGGWDEIFPSDAPGEFFGHRYFDHGELWSKNWKVIEHSARGVLMGIECTGVPVRVEKSIVIHPEAPRFTLRYVFKNLGGESIPFLFKMHAAIAIEEGDEILLPDCLVEPVDLGFSTILKEEGRHPFVDRPELHVAPPRSRADREFYYCTALDEGFCGIRNIATETRLKMRFELSDFPYVWSFQSFGGWHGRYFAVLEPCTTIPWNLEEAVDQGTAATLGPLETRERVLTVELDRSVSYDALELH